MITNQWDPNSSCNYRGDTALHLSLLYHRPKLAHFLLTEAKCNPNIKNLEGITPLQLLIPTWQDSECIDIFEDLIIVNQWNPNSGCNSKGDTALHLSARHYRPKVAHYLLSEAKCDPNIRNVEGETLLQLLVPAWSDSNFINVVKDLMATKQWDPNSSCNSKGDTALHLSARHHSPEVVHFLLSEAKCDPNIINLEGETLLYLLTSALSDSDYKPLAKIDLAAWSDSEYIKVLKHLMATKQWNPHSSCNSKGDTALHLSARFHRPTIVHFLLSEARCDPNIRNLEGETPLQLATKCPEIMNFLIVHGANVKSGSHIVSKLLSRTTEQQDSPCIDTLKNLIVTNQWDPSSYCNSKGDTALYLSIRHHRLQIAHFLLSEAKCDPNIINFEGETLLQLLMPALSSSECIYIIKDLIASNQWDPNSSCNSKGDTALHYSARHHRPNIIQFLLSEAKCDPNIRNLEGEALPQLLIPAQSWLNSECITIIKGLMATKEWDPNSSCNSKGDVALHLSARYHRPKVVHFLLSEVKCDPNIRNLEGETPLQLATKCPEIMNFLIVHGAHVNSDSDIVSRLLSRSTEQQESACIGTFKCVMVTNQWDPNSSCNSIGDTALHLSARHHKPKVVHFLLSEAKCDPNIRNLEGESLLQLLIPTQSWLNSECITIIKGLMATKQWDPNSSCNSKYDTALHLSARHHRPKVVHFLLTEAKCDPNIRNSENETLLLLLMSAWPDPECIDVIINLMAAGRWDPNLRYNSEGDTALHLSARHDAPKVARFLLSEAKCDPSIRNLKGETLLQLLIPAWPSSECITIIKDLIATKEWDPNSSCNSNGDTALHLSARHHRPYIIQFLLSEAKCDPNVRNLKSETLLQLLILAWPSSECITIIKDLIATKEWNPNSSCNSNGDTALHLSAQHHMYEVTHYLLSEADCNPDVRNLQGLTPLQLPENPEIIELLISHGARVKLDIRESACAGKNSPYISM